MTDPKSDRPIACLGCGITLADVERLRALDPNLDLKWTRANIPDSDMVLPLCRRCEATPLKLSAAVFAALEGTRLTEAHVPHAHAIAGRLLAMFGAAVADDAAKTSRAHLSLLEERVAHLNGTFARLMQTIDATERRKEANEAKKTPLTTTRVGWRGRLAGMLTGAICGLAVAASVKPMNTIAQIASLISERIAMSHLDNEDCQGPA